MKIIATRDMRFGMMQLAEGEEIDVPEDFARRLIHAGHATEAGEAGEKKPARKKAEPKAEAEPEPETKKTYRTRQVKAEK